MKKVYLAWRRLDGKDGHREGRRLLRELYGENVGGEMPEILQAPGGKPKFADGQWHFSISHSQNHAFCVLADVPVGIDAEEVCRKVRPIVAEKALSPAEKAHYERATDKNRALLTFWVMKEAAAKLTGAGIGFHPNHTNFSPNDPAVQEIDGCLVAVLTQEDNENAL